MTARILLFVSTLALIPSMVTAQVSERRVREAIDDGMSGLGQAMTGGSLPLGAAGTTGRLLGFEIGGSLHGTWMEIADPTRETGTLDFILPTGSFNARVGIVGERGPFAGLDLLGRVGPLLAVEDIQDTRWFKTVGARVGVLSETAIRPTVSVTVARTWVDELQWNDPDGDETSFTADLDTWSVRADVGKTIGLLSPYAGVGLDRTSIDASYRIPPGASTGGEEITGEISPSGSHAKAYVGTELDLVLVTLLAEVGRYDSGAFAGAWIRLFH